jgi:zinc transporter
MDHSSQSFVLLVENQLGRLLEWEHSDLSLPEGAWFWVHLNRDDPHARQWLTEEAGLDPVIREALLQEETRPRALALESGLLVILRGANLNPGAAPDDLVSIRLWVEGDRVVSLARWRLVSVAELNGELLAGQGPATPAALLAALSGRLVQRLSPVVDNLGDLADALEERSIEHPVAELRQELGRLRRQAIQLRRHLAPQREMVAALLREERAQLARPERARLREAADQLTRFVEELEQTRERLSLSQEELASRLSEQQNRAMVTLALVTVIFLPLSLLTGLLGMNMAGIPFAEARWAFAAVCLLLLGLGLVQWLWLRRRYRN